MVILQPAYSVGEWHYGLGFATIYFCAYCNALQVFQGRSVICVFRERAPKRATLPKDSIGMVELVNTNLRIQ